MYNRKFMFYFLSCLNGFGAVTIRRLDESLDPLSDLLYIEANILQKTYALQPRQTESLLNARIKVSGYYQDYLKLKSKGIQLITYFEGDYPEKLKHIDTPPAVLYVKGELPPDDEPAVAIVGSRAATNYGRSMADFFAGELSKEGISIISGMASGIDGYAHRGALKNPEGKTYAILGNGVNICYPKENFDIYDALGNTGRGGIISEFPPGICAVKANFPLRNRIISGLSDIVIVIEAREKSGSLITVDYALNQGKEIMALPGRITDPLSRGCNRLILNGSHILTSPQDVTDILGIKKNGKLAIHEKNIGTLAKNEKLVYSTLDLSPKYTETVAEETGLSLTEVMTALLSLELKGYITQISGNYYGIC